MRVYRFTAFNETSKLVKKSYEIFYYIDDF